MVASLQISPTATTAITPVISPHVEGLSTHRISPPTDSDEQDTGTSIVDSCWWTLCLPGRPQLQLESLQGQERWREWWLKEADILWQAIQRRKIIRPNTWMEMATPRVVVILITRLVATYLNVINFAFFWCEKILDNTTKLWRTCSALKFSIMRNGYYSHWYALSALK